MPATVTVQLSVSELRYLLSLVQANKDKGDYWGNHEQFRARQERVIEKLERAEAAYS